MRAADGTQIKKTYANEAALEKEAPALFEKYKMIKERMK